MKRIFIAIAFAALLLTNSAMAQSIKDAILFSQTNYLGTARSIGMGNAMTAVGGDIGGIAVNPASGAVMRTTEISITPNLSFSHGLANYLGTTTKSSQTQFGLSNLAVEFAGETGRASGVVSLSGGVVFNRTADFNSVLNLSGKMTGNDRSSWAAAIASQLTESGVPFSQIESMSYSGSTLPWRDLLAWDTRLVSGWDDLWDGAYVATTENIYEDKGFIYSMIGGDLIQDFNRRTTGGINEIAFNFSLNVSDIFYGGISLNVNDLRYGVSEYYSERAVNSADFQTGFTQFSHNYNQTTTGTGIGAKLGVIVVPIQNLRIGATFTTPMRYVMTDRWYESMRNYGVGSSETPDGLYKYRIYTPARFSVGAAFTAAGRFLLSADFEAVNYSKVRMQESGGNDGSFSQDNTEIGKTFKSAYVARVGAEFNVIPALAIRAGYNFYSPVSNSTGYSKNNHYVSAGIGYRFTPRITLDLAYQYQFAASNKFTLYSDYEGFSAPIGTATNKANNLLVTLRFKI